MENNLITGKTVSDLSAVSSLNPGDLLLISEISGNTYISKHIRKDDMFRLLSSELGYFEKWIFSYDDINGKKQSITKNVFISK